MEAHQECQVGQVGHQEDTEPLSLDPLECLRALFCPVPLGDLRVDQSVGPWGHREDIRVDLQVDLRVDCRLAPLWGHLDCWGSPPGQDYRLMGSGDAARGWGPGDLRTPT